MEQQETKITPQDIIEKEFRVKFRGFDMAEVDSFLEEVAENFFKLTEENTVLHEKILALQQDLETAGSMIPQGQLELSDELGNILEDIKQDVTAISAGLTSLKQDKPSQETLENNLKAVIASVNEAADQMRSQTQPVIPAEFLDSLEKFKQESEKITVELTGLQNDRQAFDALKSGLAEVISSAREATSSIVPQQEGQSEAGLQKAVADFRQETETLRAELAAVKQEFGAITGVKESISTEIQDLLFSHFKELEAKLSQAWAGPAAAPSRKKEKLLTAEIAEEPEGEEETAAQEFQDEENNFEDDGALEFLNEDDILDVDKLRNVFQSVLDDEFGESQDSLKGGDETADLLFLDDLLEDEPEPILDDLLEDEPEPKVTFSVDEKGPDIN
jgi:cell division initiation protein